MKCSAVEVQNASNVKLKYLKTVLAINYTPLLVVSGPHSITAQV